MPSFPDFVTSLPVFAGRFRANRLVAEGCEVLFASYPAGTVIEEHSHDTDNRGVITKGALLLTVAGEDTSYGLGDWYEVRAGIPHAARFESDTAEIKFWFKPSGVAAS